jgi:cytochrome c oxidase assembly factor CtaG
MSQTWSVSPLWIPVLVLIGIEELGLSRMRARMEQLRFRRWRIRGYCYAAALSVVALIDSSPAMGFSMDHLTAHMLIHIVEMFYLPCMLVVCAPGLPAIFALPLGARRRYLRWWHRGGGKFLKRSLGRLVVAPLFAIAAFNGVMVLWHIPRIFNVAMWHPVVHTWIMTPSFIIAGYLFWRVILRSGPWAPRGSTRVQLLEVVVTAAEMLVLAMAMSIFSHISWYSMNIAMLGSRAAWQDQQLAAGVLWICGDLWVVPTMYVIIRRLISTSGGVSEAFERFLGREANA